MSEFTKEYFFNEQNEIVRKITSGLRQYNQQFIGPTQESDVANLKITLNQNDELIGGIHTKIFRNSIDIKYLWVNENFRKQKLGTELMKELEIIAIKRNITVAYVTTFHFQVLDFYLKLGYQYLFTIDNYVDGANLIYLKKTF